MKKRIFCILSAILLIICTSAPASASEGISLSAKSAVMINAENGDILFEKNATLPLPMASTTKIMTAIVVIENCELSKKFTVSDSAIGIEGTSAYLKSGDTLTVEDALYALLLQSANDVAIALAIECAKSVDSFVSLMNDKAKELSLKDTAFKNPSGLPDAGHYTSAVDLALLSANCMKNSTFSKIVSAKQKTVTVSDTERTFVNHNKLLLLCDEAVGIKTGYTKESGRCLVGAFKKDGLSVITVTLNAPNDWNDHKRLFDFALEKYRSYTLFSDESFVIGIPLAGKDGYIKLSPKGQKSVILKKGSKITVRVETRSLLISPEKENEALGIAVFECEGKEIFRSELYLSD